PPAAPVVAVAAPLGRDDGHHVGHLVPEAEDLPPGVALHQIRTARHRARRAVVERFFVQIEVLLVHRPDSAAEVSGIPDGAPPWLLVPVAVVGARSHPAELVAQPVGPGCASGVGRRRRIGAARVLAVAFSWDLPRRAGGGEALSTSDGSVGVFAVARRDQLAAGGWPVAKVVHAGPPDHPDLADAAGDHAVAELQAKAASRDDVVLDDAAAPRASRDGQPDGRDSLAVPPTRPRPG